MTPKRKRALLIARDGLVCQYCGITVSEGQTHGRNGLVIEHVNGRDETLSNLCVSCRSCNSTKGHRTAEEWKSDIDAKISMLFGLMEQSERIKRLQEKLQKGNA